jgi:hypothetical protein
MGVEKDVDDVWVLRHYGTSSHFVYQPQHMPLTLGTRDVPSSQPKM